MLPLTAVPTRGIMPLQPGQLGKRGLVRPSDVAYRRIELDFTLFQPSSARQQVLGPCQTVSNSHHLRKAGISKCLDALPWFIA
jgi:hypothetical protein